MTEEWISIDDQLPDDTRSVVVKTVENQALIARYFNTGNPREDFIVQGQPVVYGAITHWRYPRE
ncbi:DUF551 domain-containing protein [[Pseudomonas] boreopolis]|uniref:DUF551 domain-containing protein n=1 Tax=Xanthomonas boreopolis TaxID=86183 RepID=A0A919F8V3_9XANT|nr:hypothetical protein GCM10009090_21290 [[Pseudomonas] boreopolis]